MILHQGSYSVPLKLGTRDQPIHVDFASHELTRLDTSRPPITSTSRSLPQRPLATQAPMKPQAQARDPLGKGKATSSLFVTQRVRSEPLIATPMTPPTQDFLQSLKRKRSEAEAELIPELAKRSKKSEKKRRKRGRRAARIAQLSDQMTTSSSPDIHLNYEVFPEPSKWSSRGLADTPLVPLTHQSQSFASTSLPTAPSHRSFSQQGEDETIPEQETVGSIRQHLSPPSPSRMVLPTSVPNVSTHDPSTTNCNDDASDNSPQMSSSSVVGQAHGTHFIVDPTNMVTPQTARASPSSLNRKIKERMALLIQHQRLANGADSLPPAPLSRTTNSTISQIVVDDALSTKQNSLDKAISDNKAALAQLGSLIGKEQKLALMKAVSERNMLITQLTNEIKQQLDSRRSIAIAASPPCLFDNPTLSFKWPETQYPLYLVIASDDDEALTSSR